MYQTMCWDFHICKKLKEFQVYPIFTEKSCNALFGKVLFPNNIAQTDEILNKVCVVLLFKLAIGKLNQKQAPHAHIIKCVQF